MLDAPRGVLPRQRHRLDRHLPAAPGARRTAGRAVGRRLPGHRRLGRLQHDYEMLEPVVIDIAARGLGFGIHVVLTASRYMEVRAALKDQLLNRLELRLGDPWTRSSTARSPRTCPPGCPAAVSRPEKLHFMAALPRIDGIRPTAGPRRRHGRAGARRSAEHWQGARRPEVGCCRRELPRRAAARRASSFPSAGSRSASTRTTLEPVFVDFETDPLFLVFGESESGKTVAAAAARQADRRAVHPATRRKLVVGDYRRALLGRACRRATCWSTSPLSSAMETHMNGAGRI